MFIQGKLLTYADDLSEIFQLRKTVFVEQLGIPEEIEFDDLDKIAIHAAAYMCELVSNDKKDNASKKLIATGRLVVKEDMCQIEKLAVLNEYRGSNYGDFIVKLLLNKAFSYGSKEVTLKTDIRKEKYFSNIGFHRLGESFKENGDYYVRMCIRSEDILKLCNK